LYLCKVNESWSPPAKAPITEIGDHSGKFDEHHYERKLAQISNVLACILFRVFDSAAGKGVVNMLVKFNQFLPDTIHA